MLIWLDPARWVLLRYEDLIAYPAGAVRKAMSQLVPDQPPIEDAVLPSFAEPHVQDQAFFRRGARAVIETNSHRHC